MKLFLFISLAIALFLCHGNILNAGPAERIIFDTDIGNDVDDLGALAMLHALADLGEIEILAIARALRMPGRESCRFHDFAIGAHHSG